jgi:hypothetical protein
MLWILIAMTAAGILAGCRFKAQAVAAFSIMILFVMIAVSAYQGWSLGISALMVMGSLTAFQMGYIGGLLLSFIGPKIRARIARIRERDNHTTQKYALRFWRSFDGGKPIV